MNKTTESDSYYDSLEKMSTANLLANINKEDKMVALIVEKQIPQIEKLVNAIVPKMKKGGQNHPFRKKRRQFFFNYQSYTYFHFK